MDSKQKYSRRQMLALTGLGLISPLLGKAEAAPDDDQEFDTLLKEDGTVVKVPKSVVQSSTVVKEKVSNKSLFKWLKRSH